MNKGRFLFFLQHSNLWELIESFLRNTKLNAIKGRKSKSRNFFPLIIKTNIDLLKTNRLYFFYMKKA